MITRSRVSALMLTLVLGGCSVIPVPLTGEERADSAKRQLTELAQAQPLPQGPLSLSESVARAILFNHDFRSQIYASALESRQVDLANMSVMPDLVANAGYRTRDVDNLTLSRSLGTGALSVSPSQSEDRHRRVADLSFSWNLLDFGLSYLRAQQQADKYLQSLERDRKIRQQIVQDTVAAWHRAATAERMNRKIDVLLGRVRTALDNSRKAETMRIETPLVALNYQRELLDMLQTLDVLKRDLSGASFILAAVTGLPPNMAVRVASADIQFRRAPYSRSELEQIALDQRPDVVTALYQSRITRIEARMAVVSLLPIPTIQTGPSYDSNSYIVNNNWVGASAQVAQNFMKLLRYNSTVAVNDARARLDREQALAVTAASLLQVNLAHDLLTVAEDALKTAEAQLDVASRIHRQTRNSTEQQQLGEIALIREDLKLLLTEVRRDLAATEVQIAAIRLLASAGFDIAPTSPNEDLKVLAQDVRQQINALLSRQTHLEPPAAARSPRTERVADAMAAQ